MQVLPVETRTPSNASDAIGSDMLPAAPSNPFLEGKGFLNQGEIPVR